MRRHCDCKLVTLDSWVARHYKLFLVYRFNDAREEFSSRAQACVVDAAVSTFFHSEYLSIMSYSKNFRLGVVG
jgi:hypothetical protein